jgi:beta-N-acetylhexosaminidase
MNLGPVLDVDSNPNNPIIGAYQRSLGADPETVASLGQAYIDGLQSEQVIAVAKHFPGHGATTTDSHVTLPRLLLTEADLESRDLVPFEKVAPKVGGIMTAHILFPNIDPASPASLSRALVQGMLRDQIGFGRLVVTDDLAGMAAITSSYDAGTAAVQAILAGNDLLTIADSSERQNQAFAALRQAVKTGKLPMARLDDSVRRVLQAKQDYGLLDAPWQAAALPEPDQAAVGQIADAAVTLVQDPMRQVPVSRGTRAGLVISTSGLPTASGGTELGDRVRLRRPGTPELVLRGGSTDTGLIDQAVQAARQASFVLVATMDGGASQQVLVNKLRGAGIRPIVVEFNGPSGLPSLPEDTPYIAAYSAQPELVDAAVKVLFGEIHATGRLPMQAARYSVGTSVRD